LKYAKGTAWVANSASETRLQMKIIVVEKRVPKNLMIDVFGHKEETVYWGIQHLWVATS